jgi:hypothetical protein
MNSKIVVQHKRGPTDDLLRWGRSHLLRGSVSILAGHFLLMYSHLQAELVPLMASEFRGGETQEPLLGLTRDFPEATFGKGLDLLLSLEEGRGKILLLVDDETVRFMQRLPEGSRLSDLRRKYFHESPLAPLAYRNEIARRQLRVDEILEPNFARRASAALPTSTYLFSEHILRSRFRRKIRKKLSSISGFLLREDPLTASIVFERSGSLDASCVVDGDGGQNCSGAALALMDILRTRHYENFVWFLPAGCKEGVTRAVILAVRELEWFRSAFLVYESVKPGETSIQLRESLFVGEAEE